MIDFLREQPVSFFIWANPVFWLFLTSPAIAFRCFRDVPGADGTGLRLVVSFLSGWALALVFVFGTDAFLWKLAQAKDPIPPQWERFLMVDGARDVFVLLFGWAYSLAVLILWLPILGIFRFLRSRGARRRDDGAPR